MHLAEIIGKQLVWNEVNEISETDRLLIRQLSSTKIENLLIFPYIYQVVLVSANFLRLFTGGFARAITLWPFIVVDDHSLINDTALINHERIHLRQQLELLIIFFYFIYGLHYLIQLLKGMDRHQAYLNICFERESYLYESDLNYLDNRRAFSFLNFIY